jgi:ligand-binding sensor domain-containing protein/signal transduction histidine kinase
MALNSEAQKIEKKIRFRRIESKAKLSNGTVTSILQDRQGFLWVGTDDGLNRFDGYDFKIYRNIPGDSSSLLKNKIQTILEDSHGALWASTINSGLHRYNRESDTFERMEEFSQSHCVVMRIIEDSEHNVWIGGLLNSKAFLARYDYKTNTWKKHILFHSLDPIYAISQHSKDEFWLGTRLHGLYKWNQKTNKLENFKHDAFNKNSLPGDYIEEIVKDPQGDYLWIATRSGLCRFDPKRLQYKNFTVSSTMIDGKTGLPVNDIMDICMDDEFMWIATENGGLSRMNRTTETFTNLNYDKNDPFTICNNSLWALHKDKQGRIWIGSYAKGLCVLDKVEIKFAEVEIPIENDLVNATLKDSKGRLWIGTEEGIVMQDKNKVYHFKHEEHNPSSLSTNAVNCLFEDSKKQIWSGHWNGGVNRYDEKTKSFIHYRPDLKRENGLNNPNVFSISQSSVTGELLVCTFGGLFILKDQEKGIFENAISGKHEGDQLLITSYEDSKKNIWIGSYSGLSRFDLATKQFTQLYMTNDTTEVSDRVNCILEDHKGRIWITSHAGLHQMISPTKFVSYTIEDGLPVNVVQGIIEDNRGIIWVGTTSGLVEFNPETKTFKTYDESDGLHSSDFRRKAFFKDTDGKLFVGGRGLNAFYPDSLTNNTNLPSVYITDFKVFNQSIKPGQDNSILKKSITQTNEIFLTDKDSFFSIHYVGLNFTASFKNQYAYQMVGFDKDWNYVGDLRFATYTNLSPGTYTFRVKASNNDGLWNETGTSLIIHILPPWWKTVWFRTLAILIFAFFIAGIYYVRVNTIEQRNANLENLINIRTQELQNTNQELANREQEIKQQNIELIKQREALALQNDKLIQGQEEVSSQRDLLAHQNYKLQEAWHIIELKNQETLLHNQTLEMEVEKRTQELLTHNNQLEQFAFISAHNLRAPVARILGLGAVLKLPATTADDEKIILDKLIYTTQELDRVVRDLSLILDIRKNNSSVISPVNLVEEMQLVKANLQKEIEETDTEIREDFTSIEVINTVKPYIDSILMNLISNAIKYRHPDRKPVIEVRSSKFNESISLLVSDNGLGIDLTKHSDKLFKLYSRFHSHVEGKGMGLYLVKTQIDALGGTLEVSGEVNQGITFKIILPAKVEQTTFV